MTNKTALITDVLHFVGRGAVGALIARDFRVICQDEAFADGGARTEFEAEFTGALAAESQTAEDLVAEAAERLGQIDVLVNNDAYPAHRMPIGEADMGLVHETMEKIFLRPYALTRAVVPGMIDQGGGRIIFMTSAGPLGGIPNYTAYAAGRGAVNGMIRSLALELARHKIQVNAIAPNYVASPDYFPDELMADPDKSAKILRNIPLRRLGDPREVAALVAFLADDPSEFMTGQILPMAGGWV